MRGGGSWRYDGYDAPEITLLQKARLAQSISYINKRVDRYTYDPSFRSKSSALELNIIYYIFKSALDEKLCEKSWEKVM